MREHSFDNDALVKEQSLAPPSLDNQSSTTATTPTNLYWPNSESENHELIGSLFSSSFVSSKEIDFDCLGFDNLQLNLAANTQQQQQQSSSTSTETDLNSSSSRTTVSENNANLLDFHNENHQLLSNKDEMNPLDFDGHLLDLDNLLSSINQINTIDAKLFDGHAIDEKSTTDLIQHVADPNEIIKPLARVESDDCFKKPFSLDRKPAIVLLKNNTKLNSALLKFNNQKLIIGKPKTAAATVSGENEPENNEVTTNDDEDDQDTEYDEEEEEEDDDDVDEEESDEEDDCDDYDEEEEDLDLEDLNLTLKDKKYLIKQLKSNRLHIDILNELKILRREKLLYKIRQSNPNVKASRAKFKQNDGVKGTNELTASTSSTTSSSGFYSNSNSTSNPSLTSLIASNSNESLKKRSRKRFKQLLNNSSKLSGSSKSKHPYNLEQHLKHKLSPSHQISTQHQSKQLKSKSKNKIGANHLEIGRTPPIVNEPSKRSSLPLKLDFNFLDSTKGHHKTSSTSHEANKNKREKLRHLNQIANDCQKNYATSNSNFEPKSKKIAIDTNMNFNKNLLIGSAPSNQRYKNPLLEHQKMPLIATMSSGAMKSKDEFDLHIKELSLLDLHSSEDDSNNSSKRFQSKYHNFINANHESILSSLLKASSNSNESDEIDNKLDFKLFKLDDQHKEEKPSITTTTRKQTNLNEIISKRIKYSPIAAAAASSKDPDLEQDTNNDEYVLVSKNKQLKSSDCAGESNQQQDAQSIETNSKKIDNLIQELDKSTLDSIAISTDSGSTKAGQEIHNFLEKKSDEIERHNSVHKKRNKRKKNETPSKSMNESANSEQSLTRLSLSRKNSDGASCSGKSITQSSEILNNCLDYDTLQNMKNLDLNKDKQSNQTAGSKSSRNLFSASSASSLLSLSASASNLQSKLTDPIKSSYDLSNLNLKDPKCRKYMWNLLKVNSSTDEIVKNFGSMLHDKLTFWDLARMKLENSQKNRLDTTYEILDDYSTLYNNINELLVTIVDEEDKKSSFSKKVSFFFYKILDYFGNFN